MENEKKNYLEKIIIFMFCLFLLIYISNKGGYSEYKVYRKTVLTNEAIKKFEDDVSSGENVTLNDYIVDESKDYTNKFNKTGSKIGTSIEKVMHGIIKKTLKVFGNLFYN